MRFAYTTVKNKPFQTLLSSDTPRHNTSISLRVLIGIFSVIFEFLNQNPPKI